MEEEIKEELNIYSEGVRDVLSEPPKFIFRWGNTILLMFVGIIVFLSWIIKYPEIITARAVLTTKTPPQKEFAMISAKIDSIYVKDSEIVDKNTVLAVLENTANTEDVFYLQSVLDTIKVKNNSVEFPLNSLPMFFLGDIDQSFAAFENGYFQYKLNQRLQPFSNEAMANEISLSELQRRLSSLQAQYQLTKSEHNFKKNDLERHTVLYEKGVVSQQEFENKQLEVLSAERSYKNVGISISQIRETIGGARKTSKGNEISRVREEMQLLKSVLQSFNQLKKAIKDWENTYVLKSGIDGKVSFLNYWSKNQTVSQGDLVFIIIPNANSNYIAKVKAPSQNSGKIQLGQAVNVKLQNYPEMEFGMLQGKVESISLTLDGDGFYLIDVSLPEKLITSYNKEIEFKQEMQGTAEIITEDLRLIERVLYQFKEILKR